MLNGAGAEPAPSVQECLGFGIIPIFFFLLLLAEITTYGPSRAKEKKKTSDKTLQVLHNRVHAVALITIYTQMIMLSSTY